MTKIKERQRDLAGRKARALAVLRREVDLVAPEEVTFLAHALVVPSDDLEDRQVHDERVEQIAVNLARAYEVTRGATVTDVSKPHLARQAGLSDHPGFDLLSVRTSLPATSITESGHGVGAGETAREERDIEVKGRVGIGDVYLSDNEWARACNLRDRYWLYVVYDCGTPHHQLLRVQDPFGRLLAKAPGGVIIDQREIIRAAERDG